MQYSNGVEIRLGDRVRLSNGEEAVVVFSIDTNEYAQGFPKRQWQYLGSGIMVRTDNGALAHYQGDNAQEFIMVSRQEET